MIGVLQGLLQAGKEKEVPSGSGVQSGSLAAAEHGQVEKRGRRHG